MLSVSATARAAEYVPHEVIVGYRAGAVETPALARFGVRSSSPASAPRSRVLHLRAGESVATAVARLKHQAGVAYAVPNYIAHVAGAWYPDDGGRADRAQGW